MRDRAGLSQAELADVSTVSVRAIRDLELGRVRTPRRETMRLLADSLRLTAAQRRVLDGLVEGRSPADPVVGTYPAPAFDGPVIGREIELDAIVRLFREGRRLVTITGLEGVGKTRLALAVTTELRERLATAWISYGSVADVGARPPGVPHVPGQVGALPPAISGISEFIDGLGDQGVLIVLDGVPEHRLAARLIRTLLARHERVQILVTTRGGTLDTAAQPFPLAPLGVPARDDVDPASLGRVASVRMLLAQLRQVRPAFELSDCNASLVARMCRVLDGLPGALESGARWSLVYSPNQLADQLLVDPVGIATPPHSDAQGRPRMVDSIRRLFRVLTPDQRRLLSTMAERDDVWAVGELAVRTAFSVQDTARGLYVLLTLGLLRRTDDADDMDDVGFEVLNMVRRLWGSAVPAFDIHGRVT